MPVVPSQFLHPVELKCKTCGKEVILLLLLFVLFDKDKGLQYFYLSNLNKQKNFPL